MTEYYSQLPHFAYRESYTQRDKVACHGHTIRERGFRDS